MTVADLTAEDKNDFARRWCGVTERPERRVDAARELIEDIHSSDRIERLTGNPMLLTTMALVKRKIGRLPQRRVDLYEKAVEVLLNWRSAVDAALDPREALPQLEFLAHSMCADGIQQIREDQALNLLRQVRLDFPHVHALQLHTPESFLTLLERRTGLLMQSGHVRHDGLSVPVYEFRHLTLQEYLAAIALVQGHYRGRDKSQSLEEVIAPLAGEVGGDGGRISVGQEVSVVENWREPLRLCVAACNDDTVDSAISAILRPLPGEQGTARARAILASLCLADEPNVSPAVADTVLNALVAQIDDYDATNRGHFDDGINVVANSLARSRWAEDLGGRFLDAFLQKVPTRRNRWGGLYADIQADGVDEDEVRQTVKDFVVRLGDCDGREAASISLTIMVLAFRGSDCVVRGVPGALIRHVASPSPSVSHAAAWALGWLGSRSQKGPRWRATKRQLGELEKLLANSPRDVETVFWMCKVFRAARYVEGFDTLVTQIPPDYPRTCAAILELIGELGGQRYVPVVKKYVRNRSKEVRTSATLGLSFACEDDVDRMLMRGDGGSRMGPGGLDPLRLISQTHVRKTSTETGVSEAELIERYKRLSANFGLKLKIG